MASINKTKWEELDVTRDEVKAIGNALKQKEFRDLLVEYVEEINDPENRKLYEKEITELERQRGVQVTFIHPSPGYVIKTSVNGEKKAFINICKNDKIGKPLSSPAKDSQTPGLQWSIPYCQAPPREDIDKNKNRCIVYDVIFHSDTLHLANRNSRFKNLVNDTALSATEDSFKIQLDKKNLKFPKMHYKGMKQPVVIRKKLQTRTIIEDDIIEIPNYPYPPVVEENGNKVCTVQELNKPEETETSYTTPKYIIKYRDNIDIQDYTIGKMSKINAAIPKELIVHIDLPLLKTTSDVVLDVNEKTLLLLSEKPSKYKLFINLPYCVNKDDGSAKFDKSLRKLFVNLPVKCKNYSAMEEDSGVESDLGIGRGNSASSGDEDGTNDKMPLVTEISEVTHNRISNNDSYRTKSSEVVMFLNPDIHYSVPSFVCNTSDDVIAFVMNVRNVDPSSVFHSMIEDNGFQVRFTSVGSGFFPMNYAFCVKFPNKVNTSESVNIEVWDNNIIAQLKLTSCDTESLTEYFVGTGNNDLKAYTFPEPLSIVKTALLNKTESNTEDTGNVHVQTLENTADKFVLNIQEDRTVLKEKGNEDKDNVIPSKEIEGLRRVNNMGPNNNDRKTEDSSKNVIKKLPETIIYSSSLDEDASSPSLTSPCPRTKFPSPKTRTYSESTTVNSRHLGFRSILKVGRSLSESSVDDYLSWTVEKDSTCVKKTVRFSDVICKKTYRSNSSILGQRKKNQRKTKNKKRAQQRKTSESGGESEGEVESCKETGGNLNRNNEIFYYEYSEESDLSEVSEISDVSESDDGEQQMKYFTIKNEMPKSKQKQHKRGGKKNARKDAAAAKFKVYSDVMSD